MIKIDSLISLKSRDPGAGRPLSSQVGIPSGPITVRAFCTFDRPKLRSSFVKEERLSQLSSRISSLVQTKVSSSQVDCGTKLTKDSDFP
jgi:hypothetical protein